MRLDTISNEASRGFSSAPNSMKAKKAARASAYELAK